jgi:ankyrin repeat protein
LQLNAINEKQQTALHIAVNKALIEVVRVLLSLGANVCVQDNDGDTPLHDAITKEKNEIVDLLLNANSDLATRNKNGFNCIHLAALRGNARYVEYSFICNKCEMMNRFFQNSTHFTTFHSS